MSFSRRTLLKASAASAVLGGIGAPLVARAQTAEFTYKYANNLPDGHPLNTRAKEMAAAIQPGTAALFLLVRKVAAEKVLDGLKGEGGTVMKTSLDHTKEAALQAALAGVQAAVPASTS